MVPSHPSRLLLLFLFCLVVVSSKPPNVEHFSQLIWEEQRGGPRGTSLCLAQSKEPPECRNTPREAPRFLRAKGLVFVPVRKFFSLIQAPRARLGGSRASWGGLPRQMMVPPHFEQMEGLNSSRSPDLSMRVGTRLALALHVLASCALSNGPVHAYRVSSVDRRLCGRRHGEKRHSHRN